MLGKGLPKGQPFEWRVAEDCVSGSSLGCTGFHDESPSSDDADGPAEVSPHSVRTQFRSARLLQVLGQATCLRELQNEGLERMTPNTLY